MICGRLYRTARNFLGLKISWIQLKTALVSSFRNFVVVRETALVSKLLKISKFRGINIRGGRESPKTTKVIYPRKFLAVRYYVRNW